MVCDYLAWYWASVYSFHLRLQSLTLDIVMQVTDKSSIIKCGQIFAIVHQVTSNTV
jgi:hypothetical protein